MADFSSLKQTIQTYVKQNGNEEITGNILQDVLLAIVSTMGDGAINGLASALQDEVMARQNDDGTLQGNITAEATARQQADTALGGRIDGLQTTVNGLQNAINGINTQLAEGYIYAGIATPSTNPGTPSGKVFYIAVQTGTYTHFGGMEVAYGINILKYNSSAWSKDVIFIIDNTPIAGSNNPVKSGGVASVVNEIETEIGMINNLTLEDYKENLVIDGDRFTWNDYTSYGYYGILIPVNTGDQFRIIFIQPTLYAFVRNIPSATPVAVDAVGGIISPTELSVDVTAPSGAEYLYVTYIQNSDPYISNIFRINEKSRIDYNEEAIVKIKNDTIDFKYFGFVNASGVITHAQEGYYTKMTDFVDIENIDNLQTQLIGINGNIANIAFFDATKTAIQSSLVCYGNQLKYKEIKKDDFPNTAKYVIFSTVTTNGSDYYAKIIAEYNLDTLNLLKYNKMLAIGDSLTNSRSDGNAYSTIWTELVCANLGIKEVTGAGASGGCVADYGEVTSIYEAVMALVSADPNIDLITFWGGTNDWGNNVPIGNFDEQLTAKSPTTFYGALIAIVEKIVTLYPRKKIIFIGTTPRSSHNNTQYEVHFENSLGFTLEDYVLAVKKVAEYFGLPFVNLLYCAGINQYNISQYLYAQGEGESIYYLHLSKYGTERVASIITNFIKAN